MISTVYLTLVFYASHGHGLAMTTMQVPQVNMRQCEINKKAYSNDKLVVRSYCIYGVMPK